MTSTNSPKKLRVTPRLRQAALNARPLLRHYEKQLTDSLEFDPEASKSAQECLEQLQELIQALEQEMGLTPGSAEPWDHAKLKKMEADWIEAKIRSRNPDWTAPAIRPNERGRDVLWSTQWMNMLLEVMKANKAIARLQKQKGNLILQLERDRQKLPLVQGVLTTNVNYWSVASFLPADSDRIAFVVREVPETKVADTLTLGTELTMDWLGGRAKFRVTMLDKTKGFATAMSGRTFALLRRRDDGWYDQHVYGNADAITRVNFGIP